MIKSKKNYGSFAYNAFKGGMDPKIESQGINEGNK